MQDNQTVEDLTQWAADNITFGKEHAFPGAYNPDTHPWMEEILRCLQSNHPARSVVLKKSSQIGGSIAAQIFMSACVTTEGGPFLYTLPTLDLAALWSRRRLDKIIKECAAFQDLYPKGRSLYYKDAKDGSGFIKISGATSAMSLGMIVTKRQVQEDLSRWPEHNREGCPERQADSKSSAFESAKIFKVSTPYTVNGRCRISDAYQQSDQRRYHVPCPHCGWMQTLRWENMKRSIHADASWPYFSCQNLHCQKPIEEEHKGSMLQNGKWIASLSHRETPGFHIWAAYSKLTTWKNIAEAYKSWPADLFANDFLGLQYTPNAKGDTF